YGDDRLFAAIGQEERFFDRLGEAGHPVVALEEPELGAEMFRWEFAVAVAGAVIGIQPFDQPDVQSAKDATKKILERGEIPDPERGDLRELLASSRPGNYLAIQAYLPRDDAIAQRLH